jgi:hypothetical protein
MTKLTRVTTNFPPRALAALDAATEATGDSRTDCITRAIQVYALIVRHDQRGQQVFVEDPTTGERERLVLL